MWMGDDLGGGCPAYRLSKSCWRWEEQARSRTLWEFEHWYLSPVSNRQSVKYFLLNYSEEINQPLSLERRYFAAATAAAKSLQSCPTLCDPIDSSPPGPAVPGILQARTLGWVAISFSNAWKVKSESEVAQSCLTLSDPMNCSLPGSSIHGIFQARVLDWGTIAFSHIYALLLLLLSRFSRVRLCATP